MEIWVNEDVEEKPFAEDANLNNIDTELVLENISNKRKKQSLIKSLSFFAGFALLLTMSYLVSTKVTPSSKTKAAPATVNLILKLTQDPATKEVTVEKAMVNNGYPVYYPKMDVLNPDSLEQVVNGVVTRSTPVLFSDRAYVDGNNNGGVTGRVIKIAKPEALVVIPYDPAATLQLNENPENLKGSTQGIMPTNTIKNVVDINNLVGVAINNSKSGSTPTILDSSSLKNLGTINNGKAVSVSYLNIATSDSKLDVLMMGLEYGTNDLLARNDMNEIIAYMAQNELFGSVMGSINFSMATNSNSFENLGCSIRDDVYYVCDPLAIWAVATDFGQFDKVVVVLNRENMFAMANSVYGMVTMGGRHDWAKQALAHEFGHLVGGLADEYVYDPPSDANPVEILAHAIISPNCSLRGIFDQKCKWDATNPGPQQCIKDCRFTNLYRSVDDGIMKNCLSTGEWGDVNRRAMVNALNKYFAPGVLPTMPPVPPQNAPPEPKMWCGNCNNYTCILGNTTECTAMGDADGDGNCSGQCGPTAIPIPTPNVCNTSGLNMNYVQNTSNKTINFVMTGEDASTMLKDIVSPTAIFGAGDFSKCTGTWNNKVCPIVTDGAGTWTHSWQKCTTGSNGTVVCNSNPCTKCIMFNASSKITPKFGVGYNAQSFEVAFTNNDTSKAYRLIGLNLNFTPNPNATGPFDIKSIAYGGLGNVIWQGPFALSDSSGGHVLQIASNGWNGTGTDFSLPAKPLSPLPTPYPKPIQLSLGYGFANSGSYSGTFIFDEGTTGSKQILVQASNSTSQVSDGIPCSTPTTAPASAPAPMALPSLTPTPSPRTGTNVLKNGNFELCNTTGWVNWTGTTLAIIKNTTLRAGGSCFLATKCSGACSSSTSIYQDVPVTTAMRGKRFEYGGKVAVYPGNQNGSFTLALWQLNANRATISGTTQTISGSATPTYTNYFKTSAVTINPSATTLRYQLYVGTNAVNYRLDDAYIIPF